jgi:hypothetical protein
MRGLCPRIFLRPAGVRLEACKTVWYSAPAAREPILASSGGTHETCSDHHHRHGRGLLNRCRARALGAGKCRRYQDHKDKDKDKPKKTHKKVAKTEKSDKAATPAGQTKGSEGGGKY